MSDSPEFGGMAFLHTVYANTFCNGVTTRRMNLQDLPEEVKERAEAIKDENPDLTESQAIAIARDQLNMQAEGDECPDGRVKVGDSCIEVAEVDAPPSVLASRIMATASPLDTQPIEREELGDGKVAYRNIKLLDTGVWTDEGSKKPTLYDELTFENTEPKWDDSKYNGPPVNIHHDLYKTGPNKGEAHEASVGGYIDPDSLQTDGDALFGDIILDRDDDAGAYADTNLQSGIEKDGAAGFSPSVELMPTEIDKDPDHPHAVHHVLSSELTGTGLVRDPASKSVDFAHETRNRAVALSNGEESKSVWLKSDHMEDETLQQIRAEVLSRELQLDDIQDDAQNIADELEIPIDEVMEVLDPLLDMEEEPDEEPEMEDDDDEEDEDKEMQDVEEVMEMVQTLRERVEALEEEYGAAMSADDVEEELEALADAETVQELADAKEDLDKRLSDVESEHEERIKTLEEEPKETKTLAESDTEGIDYSAISPSQSRGY